MPSHGGRGQETLWGLSHKSTNPNHEGSHLYNPIISQKPHLQILSSWGLGFQNTSLGGQKHSDLSNGQVKNSWWTMMMKKKRRRRRRRSVILFWMKWFKPFLMSLEHGYWQYLQWFQCTGLLFCIKGRGEGLTLLDDHGRGHSENGGKMIRW